MSEAIPSFTVNNVNFILTGPHTLESGMYNPQRWAEGTKYYLLSVGGISGTLYSSEVVQRILPSELPVLQSICEEIAKDPVKAATKHRTQPPIPNFLGTFRSLNTDRQRYFGTTVWNTLELAGALCGEAVELANIAKKLRRIESGCTVNAPDKESLVTDLGKEAADIITYLDIILAKHGLTIEDVLTQKFNEVSIRVGYPHQL